MFAVLDKTKIIIYESNIFRFSNINRFFLEIFQEIFFRKIKITNQLYKLFVHFCLQSTRSCNGTVNNLAVEKSFILNKVAQLFVHTCLVDYPRRWPTFFDDLISAMSLGPTVVDLSLRVLLSLDSEVVDRDIVHSDQVEYYLFSYNM